MIEPRSAQDDIESDMPQVHQAVGMLSARLDISCTEALSELRDHAARTHLSVLDVALDVINHLGPVVRSSH